jgi:hypothetical protein
MFEILHTLGMFVAELFKSRSLLEAENLFAPYTRSIERFGDVVAHPILGGLHHRYARI